MFLRVQNRVHILFKGCMDIFTSLKKKKKNCCCSKLNYKCPPKVHLLDLPLFLDFTVTTDSLNRKLMSERVKELNIGKCFGLHTMTIFKNG